MQLHLQHASKAEAKIGHVQLTDNAAGSFLLGQLDTPGSILVGSEGLVSAEDAAALKRSQMDIQLTLTGATNAQPFCTSSTTSTKLCAVGALMDGVISQKPMDVSIRGSFLSVMHKIGQNGRVSFWSGDGHSESRSTVNFGIEIVVNALYEGVSPGGEIASQWRRGRCSSATSRAYTHMHMHACLFSCIICLHVCI